MADIIKVTCPECEKTFKPKADVQGKRFKCPYCSAPMSVPAAKNAKEAKEKPEPKKEAKGKPDAKKAPSPASAEKKSADPAPAAPAKEAAEAEDLDGSPDPYGVKNVDLVPRCPNCTFEMGTHDIICLKCGYNTMTREWGKTEKVFGNTFGRHLLYLAPALGAAAFVVFSVLFLIFAATEVPYLLDGSWLSFLDGEWARMWSSVLVLAWIFAGGTFCFKKFIEKPRPDEVQME